MEQQELQDKIGNAPKYTLFHYYTPIFAMISALEASREYGQPEELALKTIQQLDYIREILRSQNKNMDWVADAQYAVAAYVDEAINRSNWHGRDIWRQMPLHARMRLQPNPGIVFFQKLGDWLKSPSQPTELLEIFYVCMGLGFQGQYFNQPDTLKQIKQELLRKLLKDSNPPERLSPNAARLADERVDPTSHAFPWLWVIAGIMGVLLLLFIILKVMSINQIDDLIRQLST
jgi:type VI secretion system protein ImpK